MNSSLVLILLSLVTWGIGEGIFMLFVPLYLQELGANPLMIGSIFSSVLYQSRNAVMSASSFSAGGAS